MSSTSRWFVKSEGARVMEQRMCDEYRFLGRFRTLRSNWKITSFPLSFLEMCFNRHAIFSTAGNKTLGLL